MIRSITVGSLALGLTMAALGVAADDMGSKPSSGAMPSPKQPASLHQTAPFQGVKADTGYAVHWTEGGRSYLKVSDDFVIPKAPAPHWQVVDSRGNAYLLQQLNIKDGNTNRQITVPAYVPDIAKVQIWCSFVEVVLGEAPFEQPVK